MKTRFILSLLFIFSFSFYSFSQQDISKDSPYELSWAKDATWVGTGLALNGLGFKLIQDMEPLSQEEVNALSKNDVPGIDRWLAGQYSARADDISYYPFYGSFAVPFVMMAVDKDYRSHAGQISVMFVESMATTGALFTISAATVKRSRPLTYNEDLSYEKRSEPGSRRAFFAGHTAATASATFFAAKIYNDFNPDSAARPYVWAVAAAIPAYVGYLRSKAGKHFLTDNIVGYAIGALSGILIPELHKKKNERFSFYPSYGREYKGLTLQYEF
ncbi:MAG: phosphatase PAP2 family protein [Salinimicrobium sp.]